MLRSLNALMGYVIAASDGEIGHVYDFFFYDTAWVVRYLVVETGGWLNRRRVLISPVALGHPDWTRRQFPVSLTREQVRNSPDVDTDQPVYRQQEIAMNAYYGWPHYWTLEPILVAPAIVSEAAGAPEPSGDPHLRSLKEVTGYRIPSAEGNLGHVQDFIADEQTWAIRYLVMETGTWLRGKKILLAGEWLQSVSWARKELRVNITREYVKHSPEFDPAEPVNREYEVRLYDYYGRPRDPG